MRAFKRGMGLLCLMILGMVVVGGITRLTGSGLSMVTWEPVSGILPPLTQQAWEQVFQHYQATPEFQKVNAFFTLSDFKTIFWWEYIHRLWGRLIGVVLLGVTYLAFRRPLPRSCRLGVILLWVGGIAQAGLGWWMVKSGLKDNPWVSPYRLSLHLMMALLLYSISLQLVFQKAWALPQWGQRSARCLLVLIAMTLFWGGLVAGQHAGLMYNTFPLMEGRLIPEEGLSLSPLWLNFLENPPWVQWTHRVLALLTLTGCLTFGLKGYQVTKHRFYLLLVGGCVLQVALGVGTLLYQVPLVLAVCHQVGAFFLWAVVWRVANLPLFSKQRSYPLSEGIVYA